MKRTKELNTNKGITLIALVITIIVMLILVGVTISMAVNGGLFDYAGRAVSETNNALKAEGQLANGGIEVDGTWYNSIDEYLETKNGGETVETISKTESYVGCYADVDGDGTADGVIYADLAFEGNGEYYGYSYSYEAVVAEELKDYYVSGSADGDFGSGKNVLTAKGEGKDRFYVMALEDVTTGDYTTFYWYYNAGGYATSTDFGTGKANTATIKGIWDANTGTQNARDLWAQVSSTSKWFVPSRDEWLAFADAFNVTSVNDDESGDIGYPYGLSNGYWLSSHHEGDCAWCDDAVYGVVNDSSVTFCYSVRLSTTF